MKGPNHVLVGHFTFPNIPNTISLQFEEKKKKDNRFWSNNSVKHVLIFPCLESWIAIFFNFLFLFFPSKLVFPFSAERTDNKYLQYIRFGSTSTYHFLAWRAAVTDMIRWFTLMIMIQSLMMLLHWTPSQFLLFVFTNYKKKKRKC